MNILKKRALMALAALLALYFTGCKEDDKPDQPKADPLEEYQLIDSKSFPVSGLLLKLYMLSAPSTGYNELALRLSDPENGDIISHADLQILPIMDMGTMMHSSPHQNPVYHPEMQAYMASSTFIMPSSSMAQWRFKVISDGGEATADTLSFDLEVTDRDPVTIYNFLSPLDSAAFFVTLKEPQQPAVGMNDFELLVYHRQDMMHFPAVADLQIEIDPQMPAMGHGSPNNENPLYKGEGLYVGKANFTMTGTWRVHVLIKDSNGNILTDEGYFDLNVQ